MQQRGRKHSLSPERSPTHGRYYHDTGREPEEEELEKSIKKLKLDSNSYANVPFSRPMNKRFPTHIAAPDDPNYMHDINFPVVNKVLNELAIIREFREKVRKLKESKTMPPISEEREDYVSENRVFKTALLQPPLQTVLDFSPYHNEGMSRCSSSSSSTGSNSINCGSPMPMDTE